MSRTATLMSLLLFLVACSGPAASNEGVTGDAVGPAPYSCPAGAPAAVFVGESAPPSTVAAGSAFSASITFANCGGSTWTAAPANAASGFKLAFAAPRDGSTWGLGRVALPADVPPRSQITIPLSLRAPSSPGSATYAWAIVHEGAAWLDTASPEHTISVAGSSGESTPPSTPVTLCAGVTIDPTGISSASSGIQHCIDATASGGTLSLPSGTFRITSVIEIDKPIILRTAGLPTSATGCLQSGADSCATLKADANIAPTRGFVHVGASNGVSFDHVVIDGNRAARTASAAASQCAGGTNGPGFNASAANCEHCSFVGSATVNALCGSGFEWHGAAATIERSVFRGNGDHTRSMMWSDGLTLLESNGAMVDHCTFEDNSDVDFISGGATSATFTNNVVRHSGQASFAGLMLDNFNGNTPGDFRGANVSGNTIDCGAQQCDFGIELGPHPWYLSANILGGSVTGNSVSGAKINVDVEGGGTAVAPILVSGNTIGSGPSSAHFLCGTKTTSAFNVSPDSFVDLGAGPSPASSFPFHLCP